MQPQSAEERNSCDGQANHAGEGDVPSLAGYSASQRPLMNRSTAVMDRLLCFLTRKAHKQIIGHKRHTNAVSAASAETCEIPYMERYTLYRSKAFGVYLQRIVGKPAVQFHDHPWRTLALVLAGGYRERVLTAGLIEVERSVRWYNSHKPSSFHSLVTADPGTWVLVLTRQQQKARGFLDSVRDGQAEYVVPNPVTVAGRDDQPQIVV